MLDLKAIERGSVPDPGRPCPCCGDHGGHSPSCPVPLIAVVRRQQEALEEIAEGDWVFPVAARVLAKRALALVRDEPAQGDSHG